MQEIKKTQKKRTHSQMLGNLNSGTEYTLEELAPHTKSTTRLTMDFGTNNCKLCKVQDKSDWQLTEFNDSWGFLCGPCGLKLSERLNKNE